MQYFTTSDLYFGVISFVFFVMNGGVPCVVDTHFSEVSNDNGTSCEVVRLR